MSVRARDRAWESVGSARERVCARERESMVCVDTNHHFVEKGGKICAALFGYHGGSRLHGLDDV